MRLLRLGPMRSILPGLMLALCACAESETPRTTTCDARAEELRESADALTEALHTSNASREYDPNSENSRRAAEAVQAASLRLTHAQQDYASCPR